MDPHEEEKLSTTVDGNNNNNNHPTSSNDRIQLDVPPEGTFARPNRIGTGATSATATTQGTLDSVVADQRVNRVLINPLLKFNTPAEAADAAEDLAREIFEDDESMIPIFRKGAMLAKAGDASGFEDQLTEEEKVALEKERKSRWNQPFPLILLAVSCSLSAGVQGMDETVINGAQIFYKEALGLTGKDTKTQWLLGLVNSAPYLCCALIGCWLTKPLNKWIGRKGTIFLTCGISSVSCMWQAFVGSWQHLFIARFVLGIGIGAKSSTVPIYAAECAPTDIRGAFVMLWQLWTAFGIFLGFVCDVGFYYVASPKIKGLNWRLMLASPSILPLIVCFIIWWSPESPRLLIRKRKYAKAYRSLCRLRHTELQASRDFFKMAMSIKAEEAAGAQKKNQNRKSLMRIITSRRIRTAMIASEILMFMQQFCGINVIAYYSSEIFLKGGFSERDALLASMGFGALNFVGAFPALYTIDKFGRRPLLLITFPIMAACLFAVGGFFHLPEGPLKVGLLGGAIYVFAAAYSPGPGPVPFTYSAEAYPLQYREIGMSLATATTWLFNFVLAITWPAMQHGLTPTGAFAFYGAWNIIGWFATLFFVPETKGMSLEELDHVFNRGTTKNAKYGLYQLKTFVPRYVFKMNVVEMDIDTGKTIDPADSERTLTGDDVISLDSLTAKGEGNGVVARNRISAFDTDEGDEEGVVNGSTSTVGTGHAPADGALMV